MTPEELQAELERQQQAKIQANAALEKQIAAGLERQKQPFVDLTPTAAFLDSLYGTKLTPASAQMADNRLKEQQLLNELVSKKEDLSQRAAMSEAESLARGEEKEADRQVRREIAQLSKSSRPAPVTPAQKAIDTKFAEDYLDWRGGGMSGSQASLTDLDEVVATLEKNPSLTGGKTSLLGKKARDLLSPEAAALEDKIASIQIKSLRSTFGGNPTEGERQALLEVAFNPRLSAKENVARIKKQKELIAKKAREKEAMASHYEQQGTLEGYRQPLPLLKREIKEDKKSGGLSESEQAEFDALNAKFGTKS